MSVSGITVNLVNDAKIIFNFGGARQGEPLSLEQVARGFISLGLIGCLLLVVGGFFLAGIVSGLDNPVRFIERIYVGMIAGGVLPGIVLVMVYGAVWGGDRDEE